VAEQSGDGQVSEGQAGEAQRCVVCEQVEPNERLLERCFRCDNPFHLNPRNDVDGIDHGDAWIGPTLGVVFYCGTCIDAMDAQERTEAGDPAQAAAQLMAGQLGAALPPAPSPQPQPSEDAPPPRPARDAPRRRYRRIDLP
jgi:hypothetical protein